MKLPAMGKKPRSKFKNPTSKARSTTTEHGQKMSSWNNGMSLPYDVIAFGDMTESYGQVEQQHVHHEAWIDPALDELPLQDFRGTIANLELDR
jgi:hypothetical protein